VQSVTLQDARRVIAAGENKAGELAQPMNIAVVDAGGSLVCHARMDGAWIGSVDISINKAFTARAFDISTKDLGENSQPGGQFFGISGSNNGRIMIFAGGIPLTRGGSVVGAAGVSGGTGEQDQAVAQAAAAAFRGVSPRKAQRRPRPYPWHGRRRQRDVLERCCGVARRLTCQDGGADHGRPFPRGKPRTGPGWHQPDHARPHTPGCWVRRFGVPGLYGEILTNLHALSAAAVRGCAPSDGSSGWPNGQRGGMAMAGRPDGSGEGPSRPDQDRPLWCNWATR